MTKRDCVLHALRRQQPEQVPFQFSLCPQLRKEFTERTGRSDYADYYGMFTRNLTLLPSKVKHNYDRYHAPELPAGTTIDAWGVARVPGSVAHFSKMIHPMAGFSSATEVEEYPLPELDASYRFAKASGQAEAIKARGLAAVGSMECTIFEQAWYLRGMDNLLVDMFTGSDLATVLLDRITAIKRTMAANYAAAGVDVLRLGDDVGSQKGMLMDPALWRKWLKPRLASVIAAAKAANPDVLIFYHSDGNMAAIIPELIEIGVEVLNPIQPECMNPLDLQKQYGDRLAFWGTIGTQTTMPFGKPEDVRREVQERIATVGQGGGLFLSPSHILEPEVSWENIEAFVEAVYEYGRS